MIFLVGFVRALPILPRSNGPCQSGPTSWETVALFYLLNYGAHVSTVKSLPGDTWQKTTLRAVLALVLPYTGICSACLAIARSKIGGESDLHHALRAKALRTVVRKSPHWKPRPAQHVPGCRTFGIESGTGDETLQGEIAITIDPDNTDYISHNTEKIHGQALLDDEYGLKVLPRFLP
jgi:hypothetical protein